MSETAAASPYQQVPQSDYPQGPLCWAASNDDVCRLPKPCPKHDLPQGPTGSCCVQVAKTGVCYCQEDDRG